VGLLIALLYKGRFPEEYEAQWAGCPRLKVGSSKGFFWDAATSIMGGTRDYYAAVD
jgi:hypothetical protein